MTTTQELANAINKIAGTTYTSKSFKSKHAAEERLLRAQEDVVALTPPSHLNRAARMTPSEKQAAKKHADEADEREAAQGKTQFVQPKSAPSAQARSVKTEGAFTPKQAAAELDMTDRKLRRILRILSKEGKIAHDENGRWHITQSVIETVRKMK